MRVFIIEDNALCSKLASQLLTSEGYQVVCIATAEQAMEQLLLAKTA